MSHSLLSPSYWKSAVAEVHNLRRLIFAALICALCIAVSALYIPIGDNLRIKFTFFLNAVGCAVYGPVIGILTAIVSDTLGYILFPSGAYFPGYLLSAIAGNLVYALLLYRRKITVLRLFSAKLIVNYGVNVLMGSVWSAMLYGKGYFYYLFKSLIKNTLLLPIEVILMAMVFAVLIPPFAKVNMLPEHSTAELRKLSVSSSAFTVLGLDLIVAGLFSFIYNATLDSSQQLYLILGAVLIIVGAILFITGIQLAKKHTDTL